MSGLLRRGLRMLWTALAIFIVFYAVLVVLGRQLMPRLDHYQARIDEFLSASLGVEVRSRALSGEWRHFAPRLSVGSVSIRQVPEIGAGAAGELLVLEDVSVELDLPRSVLAGNLIWEELSIGQVSLALFEDAAGHWWLNGPAIPTADGGDGSGPQRVLNMLTGSKRIRVARAEFALRFYSGDEVRFDADDLLAENSGDFHRIAAQLSVDGEEFASALLEGYGDPLDSENFEGNGYLRLHRIDFSGPPGIVFRGLAPQWAERFGAVETDVAAEFWFDSLEGDRVDLVGRVEAAEIPLHWVEGEVPPVKNLSVDVTAWLKPGVDWGFRLQNLDADWGDADIQPLNLQYSQQLGDNWGRLKLAVDHLDVSILNDVLSRTELLPSQPLEVLQELSPRGFLRDLHVAIDIDQDFPLTHLETRLENLAVDSWRGAPALRELSAYLKMEGSRGELILDTSTDYALYFPGVYSDFMKPGASRGRVDFELIENKRALKIGGGPIHMDSEAGSIKAAFELYLPFGRETGAANMWLIGGLRDSQTQHAEQFIPDSLEPALKNWLDTAVGPMDIEEGGFIWRGPLAAENAARRSVQVYARVANGNLDYDPSWPKLTQLAAHMSVDGGALKGRVHSARMGEASIKNTDFRSLPTVDDGLLLGIESQVQSPLAEAIDILNRSPLQSSVKQLAAWQLDGQVEASLDLAIPLSSMRDGEHYRVNAQVSDARMAHRTEDIVFESLHGDIGYSDERGLFAEKLQGQFWGQTLSARISSQGSGDLHVESSGQINPQSLPIWPASLSAQISGASPYRALYRIPADGSATTLHIASDLSGLESVLPPPLNKARENTRNLELVLTFEEEYSLLEAHLEGGVGAAFRLSGDRFSRGDIALGGIDTVLPSEESTGPGSPRLMVRGELGAFDLDQWLSTFSTAGDGRDWSPEDLNPGFNVRVGELLVAGRKFFNMEITGGVETGHWWFYGNGDTLAGDVKIPFESGYPTLELDYLVLPKPDFGGGEDQNEGLQGLLPRDLPELDFSTLGLRIGEEELGELSFSIRKTPRGVRFNNLRGELTGIVSTPTPDGVSASLTWREEHGEHSTTFSGVLSTFDLAGVMQAWDLPVLLDSEEAVFITQLGWDERPWKIDPVLLEGSIALHLKEGNFYRAPGATSNALIRLIGLINLDTWVRRLRLDFSDFFSSGVAYDELGGSLGFKRGIMAFQPIEVELPSGKMRLRGQAGLVDETIDARMVATLPVGTNLPWVAALVGGLPAAAGVYLTSRIFDKQVDKVSSLSYRVKGKWSDPEVEVDKIFSDELE